MSDLSNSVSEDRSLADDFVHHHDYSTLMLGARRKAAPHIGTPAITRHLGFWIPDGLTLNRDQWIYYIEASFVRLYHQLTMLPKTVSGISTSNVQTSHDSKPRLYLIDYSYPIEGYGQPERIEGAGRQANSSPKIPSFVHLEISACQHNAGAVRRVFHPVHHHRSFPVPRVGYKTATCNRNLLPRRFQALP